MARMLTDSAIGVHRQTTTAEDTSTRLETLQEGDGPSVEVGQLQQRLNAVGAATPPLRITAVYGATTTAAVTAFQAANQITPDGVAGHETRTALNEAAAVVNRTGRDVVESGTPNSMGNIESASVHPTVRHGSRGVGVEELQQRLNNDPRVSTLLVVDGIFGSQTLSATREFQRANPPLEADGICGPLTWAQVDLVPGPVTVGRREFESFETIEGHRYGGPSHYEWRLTDAELRVTVRIRFRRSPDHPAVSQWLADIARVWNGFILVNQDPPNERIPLVFDPQRVSSGQDMSVNVIVDPPGEPGRSDTANWHTGDTDAGLAPHEFGHMIGLDDEYNQMHASYVETTGEEPLIGDLDNPGDPDVIAQQLRAAVTGAAAGRGAAAAAVVSSNNLAQGAFSQRVAEAYETAFAGDLQINPDNWPPGTAPSIVSDLENRIPGNTADENRTVAPFLYDNNSLMGNMATVPDRGEAMPTDTHQHPVQPRHVRQFLDFVQANRPGNWTLER